MQTTNTPVQFFYRHLYLLVVAAWLITFSFIIDNYWSANSSLHTVKNKLTSYINSQESDFHELTADAPILEKISSGNFDETFLNGLTQKKYFLFFYTVSDTSSENLICWNTQKVLPSSSILYDNKNKGFININEGNGYYVWLKKKVNNLICIALIPVKWNYFIENEYLQNDFVIDKTITQHYEIGEGNKKSIVIKDKEGFPLFSVYEKRTNAVYKNNRLAILLQFTAFILILFFAHLIATFYSRTRNMWLGTLVLTSLIILFRALSYSAFFPVNLRQFELFDPAVYGSGLIARSLGDLLINTFLFLWIVLFLRNQILSSQFRLNLKRPILKYAVLIAFSVIILFTTFTFSGLIRSLVVDSQISFDVINFFTLNQYSVIGFILLSLICIGYFFLCQTLLQLVRTQFSNFMVPLLLANAVLALFFLSFKVGFMNGGYEIFVLIWLIIFLLLQNSKISGILTENIISSRLVFWLVFFSISVSAVLIKENRKKEIINRRHYAEILALKSNPANETLVNSMLLDFRNDFIADNFYRFTEANSCDALKDSLLNINTSGYSNKYETHVYIFDDAEKPLFNEDSTGYNELNTILMSQAKPTSIQDLYYYDQSFDVFSYICKKTIKSTDNKTLGYFFIMASPKKQRKDAIYPELFTKGQPNSIENSSVYAFAIYNNWKLISSHNDYPFPSILNQNDVIQKNTEETRNGNYSETVYYSGLGKVVVIAKESNLIIESMTLFSYIFCSFLMVSGLLWLIHIITAARLNRKKIIAYWQLSIRNQIHGTIILISVISFVVIGVATIMFFISRYESGNREKLSRVIRIMEKEVKSTVSIDLNMKDSVHLENNNRLDEVVRKISDIHGVDVNLYDLKGNLQTSSLSLPYKKGILSTKMDPVAYYHLSNLKEIQFFQKENIGKLSYISNYVPVIDASGNNYFFLNIPYFTSQNILKQEISNFLITIINLNAFIFLLAGIISLFITSKISKTFSLIAEKMKRINLGARNEVIEWKRNDEIGALVIEYNKMVLKLEESAGILAKTEREGAWKEMARQVAHEIKNPLTPMKLSLQFLQKSIDNNAGNIKELAQHVSRTLIEQIDHLSNIANAFSQFASIGEARKEIFDVNDTLRNVILLHEVNDNLVITKKLMADRVFIKADKTQINRLFTNLILNAYQAVPEGKTAEITVTEKTGNNFVVISITDNGQGISDEIKSNIFTPNFTTKSSGTGLGLAMCKRIVEQSEGEIWFDTTIGTGTTFHIKLPLATV